MTTRQKPTSRFRKKSGRNVRGYSQRSGWPYPHEEFVKDPNTGEFVHYTEVDEYAYGRSEVGPDYKIIYPVLGKHQNADKHLHLNKNGHLALHARTYPLNLIYQRHIQHPEDHFWAWPITTMDVPANTSSDDPVADFGATATDDLDGRLEVEFDAPITSSSFRLVIAIHNSRTYTGSKQYTHIYLGKPSGIGLPQGELFSQGRDVTLYDENYNTWIGPEWNSDIFTSATDSKIYLGL